jgi:hypothetical protein
MLPSISKEDARMHTSAFDIEESFTYMWLPTAHTRGRYSFERRSSTKRCDKRTDLLNCHSLLTINSSLTVPGVIPPPPARGPTDGRSTSNTRKEITVYSSIRQCYR